MSQTRLAFTVSLEGQECYPEPAATLDGKFASSGQLISLGRHQLVVRHPKGEAFATNLSTWYGGHDLGKIDLKRSKGTLAVSADPPAPLLLIQGPEFSLRLTNSVGISISVPTDDYVVEAQYRHWEKGQQARVSPSVTNTLAIAPKFGALEFVCNQSEATFRLARLNDEVIETGALPITITELPVGIYKLTAWHHNHPLEARREVKEKTTNTVQMKFQYGSAVLETKPPGASVTDGDGRYWGLTPLSFAELLPGTWNFNLRLNNYEPVTVALQIAANETSRINTNLTSQTYTGVMRSARQFMDAADYDRAIEALGDALRAQPGDSSATSLLREATGLRSIRAAEAYGKKGEYIAGIVELNTAQAALPDNEHIKLMLAEFERHRPEQLERMRVERLNRPKMLFDGILAKVPDADLFEGHELKTTKSVKDVRLAILDALKDKPAFQVTKNGSSALETFEIEAMQELSTYLDTSAGRRRCIIVGGQTRDDETQILFKVLEYKSEAVNKFSLGALLNAPVEVKYVPVHPSRIQHMTDKLQAQLQEGTSNLTARIHAAVGQ